MLIDYIRQVHANQNFKIKNNFEFLDFDDITSEELEKDSTPEQIEIWAAVKIRYEGKVPESYKILNLTIGDWVASQENALTKVIHDKLKGHFKEAYPNSDTSEVHAESDSAIWEDQLDYMPRVDEKEKSIIIEIELVLEAEPVED
jgi:hypothetical protein